MALFLGRFLLRLFSALRYRPSEATQPYSFFHRIVVPDHIKVKEPVMKHEEIHVKQWHSADIILFELISAVNWFNPVTYLYKKSIRSVHEFIADGSAVKKAGSVSDYSLLLLGETLGTPASFLANNFFNESLLKKRIIMLTKTKSKKSALIKYGLTAPLFLLMIIFSSATLDAGSVIRKTRINVDTAGKSTAAGDTSIHDFAAIDVLPNFPGGMPMFYQYVSKEFKYPLEAQKNKITGRLIINFVVEKDGSLNGIRVLRDLGNGLGEEAVKMLKNSPKWVPGTQNGKPVRVMYTLPIMVQPKPETSTPPKQ
ncbi:M56 family metallopeptidase [Pararcticibacter amylolyticus]|nr:M56 family metallopeptidase [Pararcticibacter amylolyticus]